jgi:hypothetical protein
MIELQTSVKQDDTTRTRTPKPGYLNLSNTSPPPEKTIFTIFRMSLLIFSVYKPYCPPGEKILRTALTNTSVNSVFLNFLISKCDLRT